MKELLHFVMDTLVQKGATLESALNNIILSDRLLQELEASKDVTLNFTPVNYATKEGHSMLRIQVVTQWELTMKYRFIPSISIEESLSNVIGSIQKHRL